MKNLFLVLLLVLGLFSPSSYAREDYRGNQVLGRSCQFFLTKLKPEDFRLNVSESEKNKKQNLSKNVIEIIINRPIEETWKKYLGLDLKKLLNTDISKFCRVYTPPDMQKSDGQLIIEGMRFFADLLFVSPIPFIPSSKSMTAIEIKKVDQENKLVEINYLEGTPTKGWQIIKMLPVGNKTKITHTTYFKGNNVLIHNLYESVHEIIWKKIHARAKKAIEKDKN